jgi:hypothetical protein
MNVFFLSFSQQSATAPLPPLQLERMAASAGTVKLSLIEAKAARPARPQRE